MSVFKHRSSSFRRNAFFKRNIRRDGFNLVEVVLAMAVIGVAFTSLFGVMPVALQNYRHSMNLSIQANVMSQVFAELQQTPPAQVLATPPTPRYFNDEGKDVTSTSAQSQAVYYVKYGTPSTTVSSTIFSGTPALVAVTIDIYNFQAYQAQSANGTPTPLAEKTLFLANY